MDTAKPPIVTHTRASRGIRIWWLIAAVLIGLICLLAWLLWQCREHKASLEREKTALENQIDTLIAKADDLPAAAAPTPAPAASTCDGTVPASLKAAITTALDTKAYAPLQGHMAAAVNVVYAATEKGGDVPPAQAVLDLAYLNVSTPPWNFALPAATLTAYRAGFYVAYFGESRFIGKSSDGIVASFGFDSCGKINAIFIGSEELL